MKDVRNLKHPFLKYTIHTLLLNVSWRSVKFSITRCFILFSLMMYIVMTNIRDLSEALLLLSCRGSDPMANIYTARYFSVISEELPIANRVSFVQEINDGDSQFDFLIGSRALFGLVKFVNSVAFIIPARLGTRR